MNEDLLYYIWRFQQFDKQSLSLDNGTYFQILDPGQCNTYQGQDFSVGKIKIQDVVWVGNITLTVNTSDLFKNDNKKVNNSDNIILHVVWQNDRPSAQLAVPVFSLRTRVSSELLEWCQFKMKFASIASYEPQAKSGCACDDQCRYTTLQRPKQQTRKNKENEQPGSTTTQSDPEALKIITHLNEIVAKLKTIPALLTGEIRNLKIVEWHRETKFFQVESGRYGYDVPKILLLGKWIRDAGFNCNERVEVIPLKQMLIIIPEKHP